MHSPPQVTLPDDWLDAETDELDDGTELPELRDELALDPLLLDLLLTLLLDEAWQEPKRASPSNRPGLVSNPPQTQGLSQSSLTHWPLCQYAMHSPEQLTLELLDDPADTDELDRLLDELDRDELDRLE